MRSCVQICVWCLKSRLFWYNQLTCIYLTEKLCDYWISLITLTYWKGRTRASTKPEMNITMQKTKSTPWYEVTSNCKEESTSNQTYVSQHVVIQGSQIHKCTERRAFRFSHLGLKAKDCDQETDCCCNAQTHHH